MYGGFSDDNGGDGSRILVWSPELRWIDDEMLLVVRSLGGGRIHDDGGEGRTRVAGATMLVVLAGRDVRNRWGVEQMMASRRNLHRRDLLEARPEHEEEKWMLCLRQFLFKGGVGFLEIYTSGPW
jgi:hypothetical protein